MNDSYITKRLCCVQGDAFYYENPTTHVMTKLTASDGDIDTDIGISMCEAYGKVFIANFDNLKVADFTNTKITTSDVGSHPPDKSTILTGSTSGAIMVVDYITSLTGACAIYGKRTTGDYTFANTETVTGTDDDGNPISFTLSADEVSPSTPHWYDWTTFGDDSSSAGSLPDSACLICLYRGRLVLSGDPNYPHQWYMSKIGDPFNFLYSSTDPLSGVAGNNTDAGEIGDIVKALISSGDDFLTFGCASSIHVLDGDPNASGSIDEISDFTGVYGNHAWTKDADNNLYFYGTNGFYRMAGSRGKPENLSEIDLPNLVSDWSADPSTDRIVVSYDPQNSGILISDTIITSGLNANYFYSLKTGGFYPEVYPTACGIYSSFYYDSIDPAYSGLILGSEDGYLRYFDNDAKDDDAGASDSTIYSYVALPLIHLSEDNDMEGKLTNLIIELAGGGSGGTMSDSDGLSFDIYVGDDAETCLENLLDDNNSRITETISNTGRNKIRLRIRGAYLVLWLYNFTESESFTINKVYGTILPAGKIR